MKDDSTHFGYQQVPKNEKAQRVKGVFDSVASKYDLMNDFMSFGLHRVWKHIAINHLCLRPEHKVLDLAGGTGDLTLKIAQQVREPGLITLSDINAEMLRVGKDRLLNKGVTGPIEYVEADAEALPFADNSYDRVIMGFGLRNVTDKQQALHEIYRVLKPGGLLLVLEFSTAKLPLLKEIYEFYSFNVIPKVGQLITQDKDSYQYLVESIRMHPDQDTLQTMFEQAQFTDCQYHNLTGGIVAIHKGYKY
jgi:demethylmenaquinone methyltransferase / 2-methoxy-6-polyprenyl-1,4-benzoquinol methylase